MPNIATVKIDYQHCEEILSTTGIYEVDGGITTITQGTLICEELAAAIVDELANLQAIMGATDRIISVDVSIPADENENWGPWGNHFAVGLAGTDAARATKMTDMVAAQIVWSGINELDEQVRNAKFWSCLTPEDVDCMELSSAAITEIGNAFESVFAETISLSSATMNRVVSNTRAGVPGLVTYHPCTQVIASAVLASVKTRRGDITPRKGKLVAVP